MALERGTAPRTLEEYLALPYTLRVLPEPTGGFVGTVEELPGCITQGESWDEVGAMLRDAIAAWISVALEDGDPVPLPQEETAPSRILLRLPRSLHRELLRAATRDGVSLNQELVYLLSRAVGARADAGSDSVQSVAAPRAGSSART